MSTVLHDLARCLLWLAVLLATVAFSQSANAAFTVHKAQADEKSAMVAVASNAEMSSVNVQISVLDATRRVVAKQEFKAQRFGAGDMLTFKTSIAPKKLPAGIYTIAVSIFGPNSVPTFHYEDGLAKFEVTAAEPVTP